MRYAPIILFVYNRPNHTKRTIDALAKNMLASESDIIVYSDAAKNESDIRKIKEVRDIIKRIKGFKSLQIIEQKNNRGLANSVINGVTEQLKTSGKVIVVEDDILTSNSFLYFMNKHLEFFEEKNIFSISAYSPPITIPKDYTNKTYLSQRISSWGWGTWLDRWNMVDWEVSDFQKFISNRKLRHQFNRGGEDCSPMLLNQMKGKIDSWAIRFNYAAFKVNMPSIYPTETKVENIGTDGSGTHMKAGNKVYNNDLNHSFFEPAHIELNPEILVAFHKFHKKSIFRRTINNLKILSYNLF